MKKYTNATLQKISGMTTRQLIYLADKNIIRPEFEDASGKGTTRLYSRKNIAQALLVQHLRKASIDFPGMRSVSSLLYGFFDEAFKLFQKNSSKIPTILHVLDGECGFLSSKDGKNMTIVFKIGKDGQIELSSEKPAKLLNKATVHITVNLDGIFKKLMEI